MKRIHSFTQRQVVLIGSCLAILAVVALVPWRLVAKEGSGFGVQRETAATVAPVPYKNATGGRGAMPVDTDTSTSLSTTPSFSRDAQRSASPPTAAKLELAQADNSSADKSKPTADNTTPAVSTDKAAREKLLVGTWRGTDQKCTFREDGTFSVFPAISQSGQGAGGPRGIPAGEFGMGAHLAAPGATGPGMGAANPGINLSPTGALTERGAWQINDDSDRLRLICNHTGKAGADSAELDLEHPGVDFKIARLDQYFLRLTLLMHQTSPFDSKVEAYTIFLRRLPEVTSLDQLKGKLSENVLHVAELAVMDSEEVLALAAWMKNQNVESAQLQLIEKTAAAEAGKLSLKDLFQWSDAEDQAYQELKKINGLGMDQATDLVEQNLLSIEEKSAVRKMKKFANDFAQVSAAFGSQPQVIRPGGGLNAGYPGGGIPTVQSVPGGVIASDPSAAPANWTSSADLTALGTDQNTVQTEALHKMQTLLNDLQHWLGQGPLAN